MNKNIAVLMTCHNRKEKTLNCLKHLYSCNIPEGYNFEVILVDDGSNDGTGDAISVNYPGVIIIKGNGNLYWNRGMHKAFDYAISKNYDYYIWLNDDTYLIKNALDITIDTYKKIKNTIDTEVILVGSTRSSITKNRTYGAFNISAGPLSKPSILIPTGSITECTLMNGNFVFIPHQVVNLVGNLDYSYEHGMGDFDYSRRAVKQGVKLFMLPCYIGICEGNSIKGTYLDKQLPRMTRWRKIKQPTGLPIKSWYTYTKRYSGLLWPINFAWPYIKVWSNKK